MLGEFNYLSTVSGGGYIGAWLATIMHGGGKGNGALSAANKALTEPADTALRSLRNYTNFLIPEGGFGSSDTWSAIVLWLRNVLLNWLVFGAGPARARDRAAAVPRAAVGCLAVLGRDRTARGPRLPA